MISSDYAGHRVRMEGPFRPQSPPNNLNLRPFIHPSNKTAQRFNPSSPHLQRINHSLVRILGRIFPVNFTARSSTDNAILVQIGKNDDYRFAQSVEKSHR